MRIGHRLGLGFGVILLLMVGMTVFISLSLKRIGEIQKLATVHAANLQTFEVLERSVEQWLITTEYIIKERNLSQIDYHEILKTSIEKGLNEIDWSVYNASVVNNRDAIVQAYHNLVELNNTVQTHLRFRSKMPHETINMEETAAKFETDASAVTESLADMGQVIHGAYHKIVANSKTVETGSWLSILIVSPVTVIFSIIYAFIITRGITKPLNMLNMATVKIANGLYDVKPNVKSSVEIETLVNAFNDMAVKLSESRDKLTQSYKTIEEQKNFYDTILSNTKDCILVMDKEGVLEYMNFEASKCYGYAIGKYCYKAICKQEKPCQQYGIEDISQGQSLKFERAIGGRVYESVIVPLVNRDKNVSKMEILRDITERKLLHEKLERLSITDQLTGLYNRRYFDETLEKELLRAKRFNHGLGLLFIDIDKFKHLNDTYGHDEGDKVLQRLGLVLKDFVRNGTDIPCRYGGEEFVVILPETTGNDAVVLAERIRKNFGVIKFHIPSKQETIQKTISIGIAELDMANGINNANALISHADKAMYVAKKQGGDRVYKCL